MEFEDEEIRNLDLTEIKNVCCLIVELLCGEKYNRESFTNDDLILLRKLLEGARKNCLNYEQFNELLLLLNQDRVTKDFFLFFFEKDRISLEELKRGIIRFRGFAMLCFGNFRFAYKQLIQAKEAEIKDKLNPYWKKPTELDEGLKNRPAKMLEVNEIKREETWLLGEISGRKINKEASVLDKEIKKAGDKSELKRFEGKLAQMHKHAEDAQKKALQNTDVYLTWDYMDIYIATSMRNKWEYEETYDFVRKVFGLNSPLKRFNLRYFDPTQSKCKNAKDKGLIEGLMLKRALCTIYLAQESDTMGKDSELAATLAQSKPVIAYVPKYEPSEYSTKIKDYPLDFFKKRLSILDAEEVFEDLKFIESLPREFSTFDKKEKLFKFVQILSDFLNKLNQHRRDQQFSLWEEKEAEFRKKYNGFADICEILARAECYNFDRRADLLKGKHPLSMQVDLQSGVANGVLVVRNPEECAALLERILTNNMEFIIKHQIGEFYVLEEKIARSSFLVVTEYERLTNSFWNLFA